MTSWFTSLFEIVYLPLFRATFCRQIVALALNIKNHFDRVVNQNAGKPIVQIILPTPLPEDMRHQEFGTVYAFFDLDVVLDLKKKPTPKSHLEQSASSTTPIRGSLPRGQRRVGNASVVVSEPSLPDPMFIEEDFSLSPGRNLRVRRAPSAKAREMQQNHQFFEEGQQRHRLQHTQNEDHGMPSRSRFAGNRGKGNRCNEVFSQATRNIQSSHGRKNRHRLPYEQDDEDYVYSGGDESDSEVEGHVYHYNPAEPTFHNNQNECSREKYFQEESIDSPQFFIDRDGNYYHANPYHYPCPSYEDSLVYMMSSDSECEQDPNPCNSAPHPIMTTSNDRGRPQRLSSSVVQHGHAYQAGLKSNRYDDYYVDCGDQDAQLNDEYGNKRRRFPQNYQHTSPQKVSRLPIDSNRCGKMKKRGCGGVDNTSMLTIVPALEPHQSMQRHNSRSRAQTNPYGELSALELSKLVSSSTEKLAKTSGSQSTVNHPNAQFSEGPLSHDSQQIVGKRKRGAIHQKFALNEPMPTVKGRGKRSGRVEQHSSSFQETEQHCPPIHPHRYGSGANSKQEGGIAMIDEDCYYHIYDQPFAGEVDCHSKYEDHDNNPLSPRYDSNGSVDNDEAYRVLLEPSPMAGNSQDHAAIFDSFDINLSLSRPGTCGISSSNLEYSSSSGMNREKLHSSLPTEDDSGHGKTTDDSSQDNFQHHSMQRCASTTSIRTDGSNRSRASSFHEARPLFLDQISTITNSYGFGQQCSPLPELPTPNPESMHYCRQFQLIDNDNSNGDSYMVPPLVNENLSDSLTSAVTTSSCISESISIHDMSTALSPSSYLVASTVDLSCPNDCIRARSQVQYPNQYKYNMISKTQNGSIDHDSVRSNCEGSNSLVADNLNSSNIDCPQSIHSPELNQDEDLKLSDYLNCLVDCTTEDRN